MKGSTIDNALIAPQISGGPSSEVNISHYKCCAGKQQCKNEKIGTQGMAIIVKEGDHLKLTCAATGNPKPQISWNLKNGHAIPDGAWKSKIP